MWRPNSSPSTPQNPSCFESIRKICPSKLPNPTPNVKGKAECSDCLKSSHPSNAAIESSRLESSTYVSPVGLPSEGALILSLTSKRTKLLNKSMISSLLAETQSPHSQGPVCSAKSFPSSKGLTTWDSRSSFSHEFCVHPISSNPFHVSRNRNISQRRYKHYHTKSYRRINVHNLKWTTDPDDSRIRKEQQELSLGFIKPRFFAGADLKGKKCKTSSKNFENFNPDFKKGKKKKRKEKTTNIGIRVFYGFLWAYSG